MGGYALRFPDTLLRNLLRAVDFLPLFYGVGLMSLLLTRHCQRIGDIIAGTLVVYQDRSSADDILSTTVSGQPDDAASDGETPARFRRTWWKPATSFCEPRTNSRRSIASNSPATCSI